MDYYSVKPELIDMDDASIALRKYGNGEPIFFIHGFPTHGYTWRKIIPKLAETFACYVLDLPGLGDSQWSANTSFKSEAQADKVIHLIRKLKINTYSLIAHNSGATVARIVALKEPEKVRKLVLFNTEIPGHRPPWIPFYQKAGLLPLVPDLIRLLLSKKWFTRSPLGFREFYTDKSLLHCAENIDPYLKPMVQSRKRAIGALKYLKGIDWKKIDAFAEKHRHIKASTLLLWGCNDKTFPIRLAAQMQKQFSGNCELISLPQASLLPHEEMSEASVKHISQFMARQAQV